MASRSFWGGLMQGLGQGASQGMQMKLQMDEHKLKAEMLKHQMKKLELENSNATQRQSLADDIEAPTMEPSGWKIYTQDESSPEFGREPQPGESANYSPLNPVPEEAMVKTPASLRNRLIAAQLRGGGSLSELLKAGQAPQDLSSQLANLKTLGIDVSPEGAHQLGITMSPNGLTTRVNPRPEHGLANQAALKVLRSGGSLQDAIAAANQVIGSQAENRTFNATQGTVNAQQGQPIGTPISPSAAPNVAPGFQPGGNVYYDPNTMTPQEAQDGARRIPLGPTPPAAVQGVQPSPLVQPRPAPVAPPQTGKSRYNQQRENAAKATKTGTETAEMELPLREKATSYINPVDLTTPSPTMTEKEALDKGYRSFKGNSGQFIAMARSAFNILDRLETLSKELLPEGTGGKDPISDAATASKGWLALHGLRLARDPATLEFFALLDSNLAQFAKAAGDAANIAVPEQEFQKAALPGPSHTKESALRLIQSKKAILRGVLDGATGVKPIGPQPFPNSNNQSKPDPLGIR